MLIFITSPIAAEGGTKVPSPLLVPDRGTGINELLSIYLFICIEADSAEGRWLYGTVPGPSSAVDIRRHRMALTTASPQRRSASSASYCCNIDILDLEAHSHSARCYLSPSLTGSSRLFCSCVCLFYAYIKRLPSVHMTTRVRCSYQVRAPSEL